MTVSAGSLKNKQIQQQQKPNRPVKVLGRYTHYNASRDSSRKDKKKKAMLICFPWQMYTKLDVWLLYVSSVPWGSSIDRCSYLHEILASPTVEGV